MQTRLQSMIESAANILIGYFINLCSVQIIAPILGVQIGLGQNAILGLCLMAIAIARSYAVRRIFNRRHVASRGGA